MSFSARTIGAQLLTWSFFRTLGACEKLVWEVLLCCVIENEMESTDLCFKSEATLLLAMLLDW